MGNSNEGQEVSDFPIHQYLNRGLSKEEIVLIRRVWDQLQPVNDQVSIDSIRKLYNGKKTIDPSLQKEGFINFDRFFSIFSRNLIEEKRKNGGTLPHDSFEIQASCLFCPYAKDKGSA